MGNDGGGAEHIVAPVALSSGLQRLGEPVSETGSPNLL